jgi:hypoxanthine phosphoribosyltransferase
MDVTSEVIPGSSKLRTLLSAEQIQKRVREMARHIADDTQGKTLHVLVVLENGFMFAADLIRALDIPVVCQFLKPIYRETQQGQAPVLEIFFSHELSIKGQNVLLVEGLVHSGVTTEFLISDLRHRGAASVRLVTLLDRQSARRVQLQPDYFGFLVDDHYFVGYGLASPEQFGRNLPHIAATT